jgi:hypothetical protein
MECLTSEESRQDASARERHDVQHVPEIEVSDGLARAGVRIYHRVLGHVSRWHYQAVSIRQLVVAFESATKHEGEKAVWVKNSPYLVLNWII